MNKNIFVFVFFSLLLFFSRQVFSQIAIDIDSIKTGKVYKLIMYDNQEFIGKVISKDNESLKISSGKVTYRLHNRDIHEIYKDAGHSVYEYIFSVSGGITYYGESESYHYHYSVHNSINGFNAGIEGIHPIKKTNGLRLSLHYNSLHRDDDTTTASQIFTYTDVNIYSLTGDYLLGNFNTKNKFYYYFNMGAGFQIVDEGTYTYTYLNNTFTYNPKPVFKLMIDLGFTAGIKISKNFGLFTHAQFNNVFNGWLIFLYDDRSYPLSAGISYMF
ncbi:MAG: hypothetical protein EHM58_19325 [Ignavibacteriae bacterium]|nr:MAG: hypothetical protein EHM58_19325 [Ignavibacteriota bacterium]